jgi:hypothetical protein
MRAYHVVAQFIGKLGNFTSGRIDGLGNVSFTGGNNVIPEPATLLLIGSELAALGWIRRKQTL